MSQVSVRQPCGCADALNFGEPQPDCSICGGAGFVVFTARPGEPCVRCSECDGHHHWIEESCFEDEEGKPLADPFCGYGCKHCDLRCEQCEGCENPVYPLPAGAEFAQFCAECAKELS